MQKRKGKPVNIKAMFLGNKIYYDHSYEEKKKSITISKNKNTILKDRHTTFEL